MTWRCEPRDTTGVTRELPGPATPRGEESLRWLWQGSSCLGVDDSFAIAWLRVEMKKRASFFLTIPYLQTSAVPSGHSRGPAALMTSHLHLVPGSTQAPLLSCRTGVCSHLWLGVTAGEPTPDPKMGGGRLLGSEAASGAGFNSEKGLQSFRVWGFPICELSRNTKPRVPSVLSILRFLIKSASARMALILSHSHLGHVKLLFGFGGLWSNTNLQTQSCAKFLKSKNLICQLDLEHIFLKKL